MGKVRLAELQYKDKARARRSLRRKETVGKKNEAVRSYGNNASIRYVVGILNNGTREVCCIQKGIVTVGATCADSYKDPAFRVNRYYVAPPSRSNGKRLRKRASNKKIRKHSLDEAYRGAKYRHIRACKA